MSYKSLREIVRTLAENLRPPERMTVAKAAEKYAQQFARVNLITIEDMFGGWERAQKTHFADGGTFDQIYLKK